jgi:hypothetical protein
MAHDPSLVTKLFILLALSLFIFIVRCFRVNKFLIDSSSEVGEIFLSSAAIVLGVSLVHKGLIEKQLQDFLGSDIVGLIFGGIAQVVLTTKEIKKDLVFLFNSLHRFITKCRT